MTANELERRTFANEIEMNRIDTYFRILQQLHQNRQQYDTETAQKYLKILRHLWECGATPDSSVNSMATVEHFPVGTPEHHRQALLNQLVSLGLVEEFRPVGYECNDSTPRQWTTTPRCRYRLSRTAAELYELEE